MQAAGLAAVMGGSDAAARGGTEEGAKEPGIATLMDQARIPGSRYPRLAKDSPVYQGNALVDNEPLPSIQLTYS